LEVHLLCCCALPAVHWTAEKSELGPISKDEKLLRVPVEEFSLIQLIVLTWVSVRVPHLLTPVLQGNRLKWQNGLDDRLNVREYAKSKDGKRSESLNPAESVRSADELIDGETANQFEGRKGPETSNLTGSGRVADESIPSIVSTTD
jgi:hypothetical protein